MQKSKPLVIGPFVGELGWEIISWEPMARGIFMQGRHERAIVFGRPGKSLLYPWADYIEVTDLPQHEEECMIWHEWGGQLQDELNALGKKCRDEGTRLAGDGSAWFWYDRMGGVFNDLCFMKGRPDWIKGDGSVIVEREAGKMQVVLCVRDRELSSFRNYHYADWHALAQALLDDGHQVVIIGKVRGDDWQMPDGVVDLTNRTTINDIINLFHHADVAVGGNTGILHLASRCGLPHISWGQQPQGNGLDKVAQRLAETNWMGAWYHGIHDQGWSPPVELVRKEVEQMTEAIDRAAADNQRGKVLITFDDGTADQFAAAKWLHKHGLRAVFSYVASMAGTPGYMTKYQLNQLRAMGHCVCTHSQRHRRLGADGSRPHMEESTADDITKDAKLGARWGRVGLLKGFIMPFGSQNVADQEHLDKLVEEFGWIRLTVGAPMEGGGWTWDGNKRLYPVDYKSKVIGITVAADMRFPDEETGKVDEACELPALCVLAYHQTNHMVGNTQNLTWKRFVSDMEFIKKKVDEGVLDTVLPEDVV